MRMSCAAWLGVLAVTCYAVQADARALHVRLDTSRWLHFPGYLLFTYTTSVPESISLDAENRAYVLALTYDGQMGEDEKRGGAMGGWLNSLSKQPFTWRIDPDEPEGRAYYTSVRLNFAKKFGMDPDVLWLGTYIDFELELPGQPFVDPSIPGDALTITFLNAEENPAFETSDPWGGNALIACTPSASKHDWRVEAFQPAVLHGGRSGAMDTIDVVLPSPPASAGSPVSPLHLAASVKDVSRQQEGVWIEYVIPVFTHRVSLRVMDAAGRERFRRENSDVPPGIYGDYWPNSHGPAPPPGRYQVILETAEERSEKIVEL